MNKVVRVKQLQTYDRLVKGYLSQKGGDSAFTTTEIVSVPDMGDVEITNKHKKEEIADVSGISGRIVPLFLGMGMLESISKEDLEALLDNGVSSVLVNAGQMFFGCDNITYSTNESGDVASMTLSDVTVPDNGLMHVGLKAVFVEGENDEYTVQTTQLAGGGGGQSGEVSDNGGWHIIPHSGSENICLFSSKDAQDSSAIVEFTHPNSSFYLKILIKMYASSNDWTVRVIDGCNLEDYNHLQGFKLARGWRRHGDEGDYNIPTVILHKQGGVHHTELAWRVSAPEHFIICNSEDGGNAGMITDIGDLLAENSNNLGGKLTLSEAIGALGEGGNGGSAGGGISESKAIGYATMEDDGAPYTLPIPMLCQYWGDGDFVADRIAFDSAEMGEAEAPFFMFILFATNLERSEVRDILNADADPQRFVNFFRRLKDLHGFTMDVGDISTVKLDYCIVYEREGWGEEVDSMFSDEYIYVRWSIMNEGEGSLKLNKNTGLWEA